MVTADYPWFVVPCDDPYGALSCWPAPRCIAVDLYSSLDRSLPLRVVTDFLGGQVCNLLITLLLLSSRLLTVSKFLHCLPYTCDDSSWLWLFPLEVHAAYRLPNCPAGDECYIPSGIGVRSKTSSFRAPLHQPVIHRLTVVPYVLKSQELFPDQLHPFATPDEMLLSLNLIIHGAFRFYRNSSPSQAISDGDGIRC